MSAKPGVDLLHQPKSADRQDDAGHDFYDTRLRDTTSRPRPATRIALLDRSARTPQSQARQSKKRRSAPDRLRQACQAALFRHSAEFKRLPGRGVASAPPFEGRAALSQCEALTASGVTVRASFHRTGPARGEHT